MLTESQIEQIWQRKLGAEVRSLYFGDFASRYSEAAEMAASANGDFKRRSPFSRCAGKASGRCIGMPTQNVE